MYIGLNVKYPLFVSEFNDTWIFLIEFGKKSSNIEFNETPPSGNRAVPCGRTDRHNEPNSRFAWFCETVLKLQGCW